MGEYVEPEFGKDAFTCPHCGVFAQIKWHKDKDLKIGDISELEPYRGYCFAQCGYCQEVMCFTYVGVLDMNEWREWIDVYKDAMMVYPKQKAIPPTKDMPEKVKKIYEEASLVLEDSPRASCALLRLALQELIKYLRENVEEYSELKTGNLVEEIEEVIRVGNFNKTKKGCLKKQWIL